MGALSQKGGVGHVSKGKKEIKKGKRRSGGKAKRGRPNFFNRWPAKKKKVSLSEQGDLLRQERPREAFEGGGTEGRSTSQAKRDVRP